MLWKKNWLATLGKFMYKCYVINAAERKVKTIESTQTMKKHKKKPKPIITEGD